MNETAHASSQTELRARALSALAGGVSSNTRLLNPPLIVDRATGSRLWDVDGVEYIDYVLGQGPNFLGYAPPRVLEKVTAAQHDGVIFAATHRREIEAAERVISVLGWPETMRFGSSSSEMVQAALRMARHATGRSLIMRFHGHYHGWFDNIHIRSDGDHAGPGSAGQLPQALNEVLTINWNDASAFTRAVAEHGDQLAAVIMEPMMLNAGAIEPAPGYLEHIRETCRRHGIVLIFDETISGFRLALGGAAERFNVQPDLAVYGKAMAAGWPCAAIVGRRDLFEGVTSGVVTHAGTFNGSTLATAAVLACLDELTDTAIYDHVEQTGTSLITQLRTAFANHELDVVLQGLPMAFHARFDPSGAPATRYTQLQAADTDRYRRLTHALIESGVWVAARGIWYVSAAHDDKDVTDTVERVDRVLADKSFSRRR